MYMIEVNIYLLRGTLSRRRGVKPRMMTKSHPTCNASDKLYMVAFEQKALRNSLSRLRCGSSTRNEKPPTYKIRSRRHLLRRLEINVHRLLAFSSWGYYCHVRHFKPTSEWRYCCRRTMAPLPEPLFCLHR